MTDCERMRLELGGYALGGLTRAEADAVDAHLAGCERCRAELAELTLLVELLSLADTRSPPAPADLRQRVLRSTTRQRRQVPALVAAALIVVAALSGALVATLVDRPPPPDAVVAMRGVQAGGIVGDAQLLQVDSGLRLDLDLAGVRPAGDGYYHAWLERDGHRVSAGTFVGTSEGVARAQLFCGGMLDDYDAVTLTWHGVAREDAVVAAHADLDA